MIRVLFGILWIVVLYFGACILIGAVAGAIAGSNDPENASAAGAQAGYNAVVAYRIYVFAGAVAIGALGVQMNCADRFSATNLMLAVLSLSLGFVPRNPHLVCGHWEYYWSAPVRSAE